LERERTNGDIQEKTFGGFRGTVYSLRRALFFLFQPGGVLDIGDNGPFADRLFANSLAKRRSHRRLTVLLLLIAILLGVGCVTIERYRAEERFVPYYDTSLTAEMKILDIYTNTAYGSRLLVRITNLNGQNRNVKALLVMEGNSPLFYGDSVKGEFICTTLEEHSYFTGQESEYLADGAYVALVPFDTKALCLTKDGSDSFSARLADLQGAFHHRLTGLADGDAAELISAMLLGTREALSDPIQRDFRRAGLSHLLAISGLHLAIIVLLLDRFLCLLRIKKPFRIAFLVLFCVGYLFLTGCSYSMLRAVLMLIFLQIAFFFKEDYDAFTALFVGGACMLLFSPSALFDLSFQMTMLATFGILAFGDLQASMLRLIPEKKGMLGMLCAVGRKVLLSLFITLCATVAILPVQWLVFGEISVLTPLSNLLILPLCPPLLILGLLSLIFSGWTFLGQLFILPATWIAKWFLWITAKLSPLGSMISLRYGFVPYIFIPFLALTVLFLIIELKKQKYLVFSPAVVAVLAFVLCMTVCFVRDARQVEAVYRTSGKQDVVLLVQNGNAMICDFSGGSVTQLYNDYKLLQERCATDIDVLMLTHYHRQQINAITRFSGSVLIRALWVPEPLDEKEVSIFLALCERAAQANIPVTVYDYEEALTVFESGTVTLSAPLYQKRSVEPALRLQVTFGKDTLCYQSAAYGEYADQLEYEALPVEARYLILGGHGPVPHREIAAPTATVPEEIVISNATVATQYTYPLDTRYRFLPGHVSYRLH